MEALIRKLMGIYSMSYDKVKKALESALLSIKTHSKVLEVNGGGEATEVIVKRTGVGPIKTQKGLFHLYLFLLDDLWGEYFALVKTNELDEKKNPRFKDDESLIVRIDSGCETGQRFHDTTCECSAQLIKAMELIAEKGEGIIINIPNQDGRGKGLPFKLGTLGLQMELELDTVEAAKVMLQLEAGQEKTQTASVDEIDSRTYTGCIAILKYFNIPSTIKINIATNNPKKIAIFTENGYATENLSVIIEPTDQTKKHLLAKQNILGHMLFL